MIYSFKLVYLFNLILIIQFNYGHTLKFNELYATDIKGYNVSFEKYENRLVIFYKLSPIFKKPAEQIKILNLLYDEYHHRGLDIVAFSSKHNLGRLFNRLFYRYGFKFDLYEHKYAYKIDEFLSVQPLTRFDTKHIFFVLQDGETFLSTRIHTYLGNPKNIDYILKGIRYDIEYYLTHHVTTKKPNLN